MKKSIGLFAVIACLVVPVTASADPIKIGMGMDLGVPDGLGIGVTAQPWTHYLRLGVSFQDNYISPGMRGSVSFTPIKFPVFPELEIAGGWFARETIPFSLGSVSNLNLQYSYADFLFGIGFGNRDKAMFLLSGGASYIDANIGNIGQSVHLSNALFSNPTFTGWIPSGKLGFVAFFN